MLIASVSVIANAQNSSPNNTAAQAESELPVTQKSLRTLIDTGHPDQALRQVADLRAAGKVMPGLNLIEGLADYAKGSLKPAEIAFTSALMENPKDEEATQMRALTLFRLGRPAEAIPLLESVSAKSQEGPTVGKADPNYILALCYMDTRRYDDARHAFAAQYGLAPDGAGAYLLSARMLFRREYVPVAREFAEKAVTLDSNIPLAHELLGEIALAGNLMDEAIVELEKEKTRNPMEPSIYDRLGDAYYRAGNYDKALRTLQQAVLLAPNSTGAYILLGKTLLKKTDPVGAATYLERARQLDSSNFMTHNLLGQAYRAMGRREDAARETETAQKLQAASEPKLENSN